MQIQKEHKEKVLIYAKRFYDVRYLGQLLFVIVVLLISWSGIKTIQTNYGLQKQISAINQQNTLQKLQNSNLELENDYYKSNQYLELAARQNFGLAAPGEKEIIVSEKVALANTVDIPVAKTNLAQAQKPSYQQNFESWVNFFLHRQSTSN